MTTTALLTFLPTIAAKLASKYGGPEDLHFPLTSQDIWKHALSADKKLIITAGMYGAGTTWTHNVLLKALQRRQINTHAAYAERLGLRLLMKLYRYDALLLKAHTLSVKDEAVICASGTKVLVPIRDPRDAVCSLMKRFGYSFDKATNRVERCAENILNVQLGLPHELLKYEDHFIQQPHSVRRLTRAAGFDLTVEEVASIHASLSSEKVRTQVEQTVSGGTSYWLGYDRHTQWHRNHLGDGKIGKFKNVLDIAQRRTLDRKFEWFLCKFDYAV